MEYRNQVAAVTGGARGLGRATAQLLAQRGAAGVRELCRARRGRRGGGRGDCDRGRTGYRRGGGHRRLGRVPGDVTRAEAELGPVTILVNNAGVAWQGTLDTYDREQVARMRQVNVDGVIHATRAVMASIRARRYGRIVNLASMAAIGTALSGNAFYVATKAEQTQ